MTGSGRALERIETGRRYFITAAPDRHTVWYAADKNNVVPVATFPGTWDGRQEAIREFHRLEADPSVPSPPHVSQPEAAPLPIAPLPPPPDPEPLSAAGPVLQKYTVIYRGGHPDYPKPKAGGINFEMLGDRFELKPTIGTRGWFRGLTIPYSAVTEVEVVDRQVSTFEGILGGLDSRQLNQKNNIHITYSEGSSEVVLRLEMLTGVTVMGQAAKCRELEDRLRNLGVRQQFRRAVEPVSVGPQPVPPAPADVMDQLKKLGELRDAGVVTSEEFEAKKTELLGRL